MCVYMCVYVYIFACIYYVYNYIYIYTGCMYIYIYIYYVYSYTYKVITLDSVTLHTQATPVLPNLGHISFISQLLPVIDCRKIA